MWNPSLTLVVSIPTGFGLNITGPCPDAALPYVVTPKSPDIVWAGDPGVPQQLVLTATDGTVTKVPNPAWTPASPKFETVFLAFPDEATARSVLPNLWSEDA